MDEVPYYHRALDLEALCEEYPTGPDYVRTVHRMRREELRLLQQQRFLKQVERGWQVPFYRRHWSRVGLEPGDIRSLDDLEKIPPYTTQDLRESIERNPPWGDYIGIEPGKTPPMPLVLQTSGGTTGLPRPMIYSPRDREVFALLNGRRFYMGGMRPYDLVQVALSLGLANGGMSTREGIWKYTGAVPVMTGSGSSTPTRRQIEILKAWKINILIAFPAYLRHLAAVARDDFRIEPESLRLKAIFSHLGSDDREHLERIWGAPVFDSYGTNECGSIAADCKHRSGMHVSEDAFILEIRDPETMRAMAPTEKGTVFLTSLYKYAAPVIRYNVNDISSFLPGDCRCGGTLVRISKIFGRSDNMVKLRGTNVYPEAIGALIAEEPRSNGEYVCIVEHVGETLRDEMTVLVEMASAQADRSDLERQLGARFKEVLGVKLTVRAVEKGGLDTYTGLSQTSKIKRLIDKRKVS